MLSELTPNKMCFDLFSSSIHKHLIFKVISYVKYLLYKPEYHHMRLWDDLCVPVDCECQDEDHPCPDPEIFIRGGQ